MNSCGNSHGTCGLWNPQPMKKPLLCFAAASSWSAHESRMRWSSSWYSHRLSSAVVLAGHAVARSFAFSRGRPGGSSEMQWNAPFGLPSACVWLRGATECAHLGGMHSGL